MLIFNYVTVNKTLYRISSLVFFGKPSLPVQGELIHFH